MPTVVSRDWTKPVLNPKTGLFGPTNRMGANLAPEYAWWNRYMRIPPEPAGSIADPKSRIYPWKRTDYAVIADAATGNPDAAAKKGAEDAKQEYTGAWKAVNETMVLSMNHQVAPKDEALSCASCHGPKGILDFGKLGDSEERAKRLRRSR